MREEAKKLSMQEFLEMEEPREVQELIGKFNGGTFMTCHTHVFAETGIWIDELVPVFQKFDAQLAATANRVAARLI